MKEIFGPTFLKNVDRVRTSERKGDKDRSAWYISFDYFIYYLDKCQVISYNDSRVKLKKLANMESITFLFISNYFLLFID